MTENNYEELKAEATAVIQLLTQQRDTAQVQCITLVGQIGILQARLQALQTIVEKQNIMNVEK